MSNKKMMHARGLVTSLNKNGFANVIMDQQMTPRISKIIYDGSAKKTFLVNKRGKEPISAGCS